MDGITMRRLAIFVLGLLVAAKSWASLSGCACILGVWVGLTASAVAAITSLIIPEERA